MFSTVAEYILTFGRVPRQPRIISRSGNGFHIFLVLYGFVSLINNMEEGSQSCQSSPASRKKGCFSKDTIPFHKASVDPLDDMRLA